MHNLTHYGRRIAPLAAVATLLAFAACSSDSPVGATPQLPGNPVVPPQYRGAAFIMDVSPLKKTIKITAPTSSISNRLLAPDQRGLVYAATPASDFICGTLQLAAGMNLHVFTTGRGTPYGLAACPVIKVATRSELARRWHDLMDLNAGPIAEGSATIEDVGWELFRLMLEVASGKRTWAEHWKLHNALVLFNPAPVT